MPSSLLVLVGLGVFALTRLDPKDFVGLIDAKVQEATGRELKIDGKVGYSLSLRPTVAAEGVRFSNAPWGSRPDMVTAKRVEIQIALLPLVSGKVEVRGLTLIEPDVLLEISGDGAKNWQFKPAGDQDIVSRLDFRAADRDTQGAYRGRRDHLSGAKVKARHSHRCLNRITLTGSADDLELKGTASVNEVPIEVDAKVDHGGRLGTAGAVGKASSLFPHPGNQSERQGRGSDECRGAGRQLDLRVTAEARATGRRWRSLHGGNRGQLADVESGGGAARAKGESLLIEAIKANLGKEQCDGDRSYRARREGERLGSAAGIAVRGSRGAAGVAQACRAAKPSADGRNFRSQPFRARGPSQRSTGRRICASRSSRCAMARRSMACSAQANFDQRERSIADPVRIAGRRQGATHPRERRRVIRESRWRSISRSTARASRPGGAGGDCSI